MCFSHKWKRNLEKMINFSFFFFKFHCFYFKLEDQEITLIIIIIFLQTRILIHSSVSAFIFYYFTILVFTAIEDVGRPNRGPLRLNFVLDTMLAKDTRFLTNLLLQ